MAWEVARDDLADVGPGCYFHVQSLPVRHPRGRRAGPFAAKMARGVAVVGINSMDVSRTRATRPSEWSPRPRKGLRLSELARRVQEVAHAYRPCTPDFLFEDWRLVYRGQMDDSRPQSGVPVTGRGTCGRCVDAVLAGQPVSQRQRPSWAATSSGRRETSRSISDDYVKLTAA